MKQKKHRLRFLLFWLLTVILTVVIFVFTAFGFIFHVLYPRGGEMFASDLLAHSFTRWIPPIYYSSEKIDEIRAMRQQNEFIVDSVPDGDETAGIADGDE